MEPLTLTRAAELLVYDPDTGLLTWRVLRNGRVPAGAAAGSFSASGYRRVLVDKRKHMAHRLAFLLMTGAWPVGEVDHINGDRADNRWSNLRAVDVRVNRQNERRPRTTNSLGVLGVMRQGAKYVAQIRVNGKRITFGPFGDVDAAHIAYLEAKRRFHPGCTI